MNNAKPTSMLSLLMSTLLLSLLPVSADETPYRLVPQWDYPVLSVGLLGAGYGFVRERDIANRKFDPTTYNRSDIPAYDRWTIGFYSPPLSTLSDVLIVANGITPALLSGFEYYRGEENFSDGFRDFILYSEVVAFASAVSLYSKTFLFHPRPLAFTNKAPQADRESGDSRSSFFSEHATGAFAAAVFSGYTFQLRHPDSEWTPWIWTGSLVTASSVAALRVLSGKHFPSDVVAGATAGALIGYLVPRMHANLGDKKKAAGSRLMDFYSRTEFAFTPSPGGSSARLVFRLRG